MPAPILAIFDLDNTLLEGDCEFLWTQFLFRHGIAGTAYLEGIEKFFRQYEAGTLDYSAYEAFFIQPLTHLPFDEVLRIRDLYLQEIRPLLRPSMIDRIHWHQEQGHALLVISASDDFICQPIARLFGISDVICTRAEVCDGKLTGHIGQPAPFREGKVELLNAWLVEKGFQLEGSWGYSDSYNDLPLLLLAEHPVAVTPDARLLQHALDHGWEVIGSTAKDG
jgi:HAD superfamily hydrolase (TIGR01490 family)